MGDLFLFGSSPKPATWVGRTVMLNVTVQPRFQTKGFALNPKNLAIACPPDIIEEQIQRAVDAGVLIDITDAGVKELKVLGSELSPVKAADTKRLDFFTGTDTHGNRYFITPKDEADYQRMLEEIQTTGGLKVPKEAGAATGVSFAFSASPVDTLES